MWLLTAFVSPHAPTTCSPQVAGKRIRNGVVGFHGNIRAFMRQTGTEAALESQLSELSEAEREEYQMELEQTLVWERTFFADLGIDQALFERTQRPDKGMNNGKTYAFLLPTPATFSRYGIRNVEGVQSLEIKQEVEKKCHCYFLLTEGAAEPPRGRLRRRNTYPELC